ncbi:MAG: primase-helicase family protein [Opitutus sp.]
MPFYYLPNLSAHQTQTGEPWSLGLARPQFANKDAYRAWCLLPSTQHAFISAVEGKYPGMRISDVNPATRMCGLITDYDAAPDSPPDEAILSRAPTDLRPAYVSRTFSGNCRVLHLFESPVALFTPDIGREFVKKLSRELKLRQLLPGFEAEAPLDLSKYYEVGENWTVIGDAPRVITTNLLMAWLTEASNKHRWDREGTVVPIEVLREEAATRFPDRWPGGWDSFAIGARGTRFWDDSASDPMAAIVRETGMQYFSDGGGFMPWEAILGIPFMRQWADNRIGAAIGDFYYDGRNYWTQSLDGKWGTRLERDVARTLQIKHKLFRKSAGKNAASEIEVALHDICEVRRVDQALPFVYRPDGCIDVDGSRCLNTSTRRPVLPIQQAVEWAEGFPKIANLLDQGFPTVEGTDGEPDPNRQRDHLLAWIQHFYVGALHQDPRRGLALFIAGPAGAGKNLLNKAIVGRLMGGSQDASKYLLSEDKFNDPLFEVGHWRIDDAVPPGDEKGLQRFAQMLKQIVANDSLVYRRMYGSGRDHEFIGRVIVTINDDPESLRLLPPTDINVSDKFMALLMKKIEAPGWEMSDAQIDQELPFLAAFLRDWVPPAYTRSSNPRFGVATYVHPTLEASAASSGHNAAFTEVVNLWRTEWFAAGGPGESDIHWVGTPSGLIQAMNRSEGLKPFTAKYSSESTGRYLNKLIKAGAAFIQSSGHRRYTILRPALSVAA